MLFLVDGVLGGFPPITGVRAPMPHKSKHLFANDATVHPVLLQNPGAGRHCSCLLWQPL